MKLEPGTRSGNGAAAFTKHRSALATLSLVLFLTFLDNTVVSVTLADIQSSLHVGVSELQWIVNGYALTFAALMLTAGTLGDLFGRKKVMLGGVVVFCLGSLLAALAPDANTLVAGRVIMGIGAAASEPGTLSMIRQMYTDRTDRARALGVWAAVSGLALAMGPVIGGVLVGLWSWRAVFWFNLFFGAIALIGAAVVLPENSDPMNKRLDIPGFILGAGALAGASTAVIAGETAGYATWWIELLFGLSLLAGILFVLFERRAANPVLNVSYFRRPAFAGSNFVAFATYFGVFSIFFFVALYLEVVASQSSYALALEFLPMAVGMVLASILTGRWVALVGPRAPMAVGCALSALGIFLTNAFIGPHAGFLPLGWTLLLAGVGFGMAIVPVTSSALSVIPSEHSGMAASCTNTSRELGAVAGVAVLGSVVNGQLTVQLAHRLTVLGIPQQFQNLVITAVTTGSVSKQAAAVQGNKSLQAIVAKVTDAAYGAFAHGLDLALTAAGALMILALVVSLLAIRVRRPDQASGEGRLPRLFAFHHEFGESGESGQRTRASRRGRPATHPM
ncbi:MAG: MFS transporter [Acidimicrobiales bacterium]